MATLISNAVNWPACPVFDPGPYESGSNLYTFWAGNLAATPKSRVDVFKSTDAGATWSFLSTGPTLNSAGTGFTNVIENNSRLGVFECVEVSGVVYVAYLDSSAQICIDKFTLATETWASFATGGPVVVENADPVLHIAEGRVAFCDDGAGGFVFHYHGTSDLTHYARVNSSGTWTSTGTLVSVNVSPDVVPAGDSVRPLNCVRVGSIVHFFYTWRVITERALNLADSTLSPARYCLPDLVSTNGGLASQVATIRWGEARVAGDKIVIPMVLASETGTNRFYLGIATSAFTTTWTTTAPDAVLTGTGGTPSTVTTPQYSSFLQGASPIRVAQLPAGVTVTAQEECYVAHWASATYEDIVRAEYIGGDWVERTGDVVPGTEGDVALEIEMTATHDPVPGVYARRVSGGIGLIYIYRASASAVHEAWYQLVADPCAEPAPAKFNHSFVGTWMATGHAGNASWSFS